MHREWASLKGMPYYDSILPAVLRAQSHPIVDVSRHDVKDAMDAYAVNEPQARAILGAMNPNATGFVLIQGSVRAVCPSCLAALLRCRD